LTTRSGGRGRAHAGWFAPAPGITAAI
jgi:hypothetical protein